MASYDLSTGNGSINETYSKSSDILLALDDTIRFLEIYPSKEIILENKLGEKQLNEKITFLDVFKGRKNKK